MTEVCCSNLGCVISNWWYTYLAFGFFCIILGSILNLIFVMLYFKQKKRNSLSIDNSKLTASPSSVNSKRELNNEPCTPAPIIHDSSNNKYMKVHQAIPIQFQSHSQSMNITPISNNNNNYNKSHRSKSINENIFKDSTNIHRDTPYNRQSESPFSLVTLSEDIKMQAVYSKNKQHRRQKQKKQLREISALHLEDDQHHRNHDYRRHHSHNHGHTHRSNHHHKHYQKHHNHNRDEHHYRSQKQLKRKQNRKSSYNSNSIGSKSRSGGIRKKQKRKIRRHAIIRLSSSRSADRPLSKKSRTQELEEEDEKVQLISDEEKNGHYGNMPNSNVRMMNGMNCTAISSYSASPSKSRLSHPSVLSTSTSLKESQQLPISRNISHSNNMLNSSQDNDTKNTTIDNKSRSRSAGNVHKKKAMDASGVITRQHSHSRSFNKRIEPLSLISPDSRHLPHIPSQIELDWNTSHDNDSGRCMSSSPQPQINVIVFNNHSSSNLNNSEHMSNTITDAIAIAQAQQISQQLSQNFAHQSLSSLVNSPPPQVYSNSNTLNDNSRRKKSAMLDVNAKLNDVDVEYAEGVSDIISPFSRLNGDIVVVDGKVMYAHGQEQNMNRIGRKNGSDGGVKYLQCANEILPATNDCSEGMTDDDDEEESSFTIPSVCELLPTTNVGTGSGHRLPKNNVTGSGQYM